jgi:S-adenosylmethionine:tRNA-ribosyltransferase-isomerase (queuine synthetase)
MRREKPVKNMPIGPRMPPPPKYEAANFELALQRELIASCSSTQCSQARFMVLHRSSEVTEHRHISDLTEYIADEHVCVNNSAPRRAWTTLGGRDGHCDAEAFLAGQLRDRGCVPVIHKPLNHADQVFSVNSQICTILAQKQNVCNRERNV